MLYLITGAAVVVLVIFIYFYLGRGKEEARGSREPAAAGR